MFNFAAAVSERIRNFRGTKEETFVQGVENEFSAKGGGDKTPRYLATNQPSTSEEGGCISVDLPGGGVQLMRGDTGQGEQVTGQSTCADSVSQGDVHRDGRCSPVIARDERSVKPPLVGGPHLRRLLPLRTKLCPRRIRKVHPLDGSLTQQSSAHANDAYPQLPALSSTASIFLTGHQRAVGNSRHQASANSERVGSVSTACVETNLPSIDKEQTALTCNGRSRKPWTERLRTFLQPRRQQNTTTPSNNTPLKSSEDQNADSGTRNRGRLVPKQSHSRDVEHKEFRPAPPKEANPRKGQATRKPMRCIGVVSANNPPVVTSTVASSARNVTYTPLDNSSEKPQGLAEYDDEVHTVTSSLHDILAPSFTAASKRLPLARSIAKTNCERLPAVCLQTDVFSQSVTCSSSKQNDKKCQQLGYMIESSSGLNNQPPTSLLPPINIPKHNSSSKSKKRKTKRARKERLHNKVRNKDAVAMVTQSSGPSSSIRTESSDNGTKIQDVTPECLPAISLKSDAFTQSDTSSSSKMNERKYQDFGKLSRTTYIKVQEVAQECLPAIYLTREAFPESVTSSARKMDKRKYQDFGKLSRTTYTKEQEVAQECLPAICPTREAFPESVTSSARKMDERKYQDFGKLSRTTYTKEQEVTQECLPAICPTREAFPESVTSSARKMDERKYQDFGKLSRTTYTKEQEVSQECLPAICLKSDVISQSIASSATKCQDTCHFPPCSSASNNGQSTSILPSIAFPKDNSSSEFKEQTTVRVRDDRLKTDAKNRDAAARVKQSSGPSSSIKPNSSDDDIREQETSQDPVVEEKYHFTLREQRIALELDVKYVHENKYVQWEWLNVIESCMQRAEELHNERINGAKNAPMTPVEIAEEIYKNADIATEKLDQLFELNAADQESDSEMSPIQVKKSPAKSSSSKAKKCRNKRHTKKQRPAAEESAGRSPGTSDHNKHFVDVTAGNQEDSGTTRGPQCGLSVHQNVLPQIVPPEFQQPSNVVSTGEADTDTKRGSVSQSHRPRKRLPDVSSFPFIEAADLEHVVSWNGSKVILGKGSTANVFLMRRLSDGTLLAVKKMKSGCIRVTYDEDMLTEVTALRDVGNSPFIPKFLGLVDYRSFALELLGDGSANSVQDLGRASSSNKNPLSCLDLLHVCRDVTSGLMSLHKAGWLHNDLHAGNVIMCRNPPGSEVAWTGKVIDLGCAQRIGHPILPRALTQEEKQEVYQNATQVAPEVIEGLTGFTVESDTYSLGKVFVEAAGHVSGSLSSVRRIGKLCASRDPAKRPKLKYVYKKLRALCRKKMTEEKRSPSP